MEFSISGLKEEFSDLLHHVPWNLNLGVSGTQILICLGGIVLMEYIHIMQNKFGLREWLKKKPIYLRWGIYYTGFLMILFLGMFENRQFIYFQF
jgi:hypothetical protein